MNSKAMMSDEQIVQEKKEQGLYYHRFEDPWDYFPTTFGFDDYIKYGIFVFRDEQMKAYRSGASVFTFSTASMTLEKAREYGFIA